MAPKEIQPFLPFDAVWEHKNMIMRWMLSMAKQGTLVVSWPGFYREEDAVPKCLVCLTKFYRMTRLDPAEDCDCGANFTAEAYFEDGGEEEFRDLKERWKRVQEEERE